MWERPAVYLRARRRPGINEGAVTETRNDEE